MNTNGISRFFKDTKPSGQLAGWCLLLVMGFILSSGLTLLVPASPFHTATDIRVELVMQGCAQLLMFLLPALAFALLFDGRPAAYLKMDLHGRKWLLGLLAVVMLVLLLPLCDKLTVLNHRFTFGPLEPALRSMEGQAQATTERLLSLSDGGDLALQLLTVALLPAVCEELFFRGCLQQLLCGWMRNKHAAIVIAAAVFALAHGDAYGLLPRLLLGLLLGYVFFYSGSIVANMCVHFVNNALVVVMYYLYHRGAMLLPPTEPLGLPWLWTVLCAAGALLLAWQYFVKAES